MTQAPTVSPPPKYDVFGVQITATEYDDALAYAVAKAQNREPTTVAHVTVHSLVTAHGDNAFRAQLNAFDMAVPDGQPVRWAANYLHRLSLRERVYGPEFMLRLCAEAAEKGVSVYLYGSTQDVIDQLRVRLVEMFPGLLIADWEAPPFRPLTEEEDRETVARINASGAGLLFVGLGAPRQEAFAQAHRDQIRAVQVCVGAAFDFHAGNKKMAPRWMQRRGLEWLYRLICEPRRLLKRYMVTNTIFLWLLACAVLTGRRARPRTRSDNQAPGGDHDDS